MIQTLSQHPCQARARHLPWVLAASIGVFWLSQGVFRAAIAAESDFRGPDVTIIAEEEKTIYEYRQGGMLRMVRIVPRWGKPYYLVPADRTTGFGDLERAEKLIPSWVIIEF